MRIPAVILLVSLLSSFPAGAQTPKAPLTLREALELAARNNEAPAIAATRVAVARAQRREALALVLPDLVASGTYTRRGREVEGAIGPTVATLQALDAFSSAVTLQTSLFNPSAIPLLQAAERTEKAAELNADEVRRLLAFDTAEGFFAVLSAEQLAAAAVHRREFAASAVEEARARQAAGLATINEVTRSELELANAELARTQTANAITLTRLSLGYLLAAEVNGPLAAPPEEPVAPGRAEELTDAALAGRVDLQAQQARTAAARAFAREPWFRLIPSLGLLGAWRATNESGLSGYATDWNVALTLSWVLYDGGIRYAQAAARSALLREAELNEQALGRRVALDVRVALAQLQTSEAALGQAEVRARVARQNAIEVRERFAQGLATALERADATSSEFEAEAGLARQRYERRVSQLALLQALGKWPGEEAKR